MFPVSICVATIAMLSGIGGAAYFVPIFWIIFPLMDTYMPLESGISYSIGSAQVIAVALFTEVFGFSSGFVGYYRKHLIDFKVGWSFAVYSVPIAMVGAILLITGWIPTVYLQLIYGLMMVFIAYLLFKGEGPEEILEIDGDKQQRGLFNRSPQQGELRKKIDNKGNEFQ